MAMLTSSLCFAAPDAFRSPSPAELLEPGANLEASWSIGASELAGKNEMELVLSLDGGATFPVRLTGRIRPGDRLVDWRVPALPTEHARIALRSGSDEEGETESVLFVSEEFSITSTGGATAEELFAVGMEWRTREALEGAPAQHASASFSPANPGPVVEPMNGAEAGIEDGPAVAATIDSLASNAALPSAPLHRHFPLPAALRKAPVPLRL